MKRKLFSFISDLWMCKCHPSSIIPSYTNEFETAPSEIPCLKSGDISLYFDLPDCCYFL